MPDFGKRLVSDIVPPLKNKGSKHIDINKPQEIFDKKLPKESKSFKFLKQSFFKIKIILLALFIFFAYVVVSIFFSEMKVEITPKKVSVSLDEIIELSDKLFPGKLVFSEISLSDKRSGFFSASEKKSLESKANGVITVFNKNSSSQVLVTGTRFESPLGKIYKTEKAIVVPANGSLDTEVVAQSAGAEFNEENLVDFTIPAFKEQRSPKFNTIYAKSKTRIAGGFFGATFVVGQEDIKKAKHTLLKEAMSETNQSLIRKTPDDSFLLAQSIKYSVLEEKSEPKIGQAGEKFTFEITGAATGLVVPRELLEKILGKKIPNYGNLANHFKINNIENLSFGLMDAGYNFSDFKLKVKGIAEFIGALDKESTRDDIFEKKLKTSSAILEALPAASLIKVRFHPFWLRSFPDTKERIDIKIGPS